MGVQAFSKREILGLTRRTAGPAGRAIALFKNVAPGPDTRKKERNKERNKEIKKERKKERKK